MKNYISLTIMLVVLMLTMGCYTPTPDLGRYMSDPSPTSTTDMAAAFQTEIEEKLDAWLSTYIIEDVIYYTSDYIAEEIMGATGIDPYLPVSHYNGVNFSVVKEKFQLKKVELVESLAGQAAMELHNIQMSNIIRQGNCNEAELSQFKSLIQAHKQIMSLEVLICIDLPVQQEFATVEFLIDRVETRYMNKYFNRGYYLYEAKQKMFSDGFTQTSSGFEKCPDGSTSVKTYYTLTITDSGRRFQIDITTQSAYAVGRYYRSVTVTAL